MPYLIDSRMPEIDSRYSGLPILCRHLHGMSPLASNHDRLMRLGRLIHVSIEAGASFAGGEYLRRYLLSNALGVR